MSEYETPCHVTHSGDALLNTYAIETATCCGLLFEAHDETVTDHVVTSVRLWNAQLHDMVDSIEREIAARLSEADSPLGHGTPVPEEAELPSGDARIEAL